VRGRQIFIAAIVAAGMGAYAASAATAEPYPGPATYWNGVLAPAGTPAAIVEKLNAAINASLQTAEMRSSVTKLGMAPRIATTREFGALIAAEYGKWLVVAKAADIKVE
jgi:tripartite-type tricarboxylate transporter receptor subunit TctC